MINYTSSSTIDNNTGTDTIVTSWFTSSSENVQDVQYNDVAVAVYRKTRKAETKNAYHLSSICLKMEEAVHIDKSILFNYKNCSN